MTFDLRQLPLGTHVEDLLLVLEVEHRESSRGAFTTLRLRNRHGELASAPFWAEDQPRVAGIERGTVVEVTGDIGQYNGRRQLRVGSLRCVDPREIDWRRLLPSVPDVAPYWDSLDRWREGIRGRRLRHTLDLFYTDVDFRGRYQECPASTTGHHAALGGLLQHTFEVAAIGRAIAKVSQADQDLVVAGALLHDMGKLEAYRWAGGFEVTECGALLGHVTLGMLMLDRRVRAAVCPPCNDRELAILQHLIASHHGQLELGAAVPPMTHEAEVLHFADNASAKTASMAEALADPDIFLGAALVSTKALWQLDRRRAYRGSSDWGASGYKTERPPSRG